ncbi:hypothetical protein N7454_004365 [Penicillium verhagenii]|nr:hypothetical protein N7454_004365 [Penicillium verhagenii]
MPFDEEGGKWACESCVRGHRSSKCEHWDRIMVKIHKAGRPLTKCPHDGHVCDGNCTKTTRAFVVKIMKGSNCLCRPVRSALATGTPDDLDHPTPTPAPLPQIEYFAPGNTPKPGRKKSVGQKKFENHTEAVTSIPEHFKVENGTSNNLAGLAQYDQPQERFHQYRNHAFSTAHSLEGTPSSRSSQSTTKTQPEGSSCPSKRSHQPAAPNDARARQSHASTWNDTGMNDIPYTLPTWEEENWHSQDASPPPRPSHGRYLMSTPQPPPPPPVLHAPQFHIQNMHMPQYYSGYAPMVPPASYPAQQNTLATTPDDEINLVCTCGPGCQCVGCASHPFNHSTRQVVQEMGILLVLDGVEQSPGSHAGPPQHHAFQSTATPSPMSAMQGNQAPFVPSPPSMPVRQQGDQQQITLQGVIQPDYDTLEYAVNLPPCSNPTGICLCGDDCECIECLTHGGHNGVGVSMSTPQIHVGQAQEIFNGFSTGTTHSNQPWDFGIDLSDFEELRSNPQVPMDM